MELPSTAPHIKDWPDLDPARSNEAFGLLFHSMQQNRLEPASEIVKESLTLEEAILKIRALLEAK